MIYFKKIVSLARRGLNKMMFLIKERFDLIEVKILSIGLGLCALTGLYFLFLLFTDPSLYSVLSSTAVVHLMGGRALGIARCLSAGISLFYTILYNFYLEIVIVLVAYGIIVLIMRNVIQPKIFHSAVRQAELTAQSQKTNIKRYGAIGLFLFVMFPFFMTGPVIGAVIGYLLNYKAINNFLIVFRRDFDIDYYIRPSRQPGHQFYQSIHCRRAAENLGWGRRWHPHRRVSDIPPENGESLPGQRRPRRVKFFKAYQPFPS